MLSTTVVMFRSVTLTIRSAISLGTRPLKFQITLTTGMLMLGKMSVGVRRIERTPMTKIRMDITTKVYGLRNASRTIHICIPLSLLNLLGFRLASSHRLLLLGKPGQRIPNQPQNLHVPTGGSECRTRSRQG